MGLKVVHYVNQFFGGIGGEDRADEPLTVRDGPVGPGLGLQKLFGEKASISATIVAGDNFFNTRLESVRGQVQDVLRRHQPDVVIAGPAFNAGRYGMACGEVCHVSAAMNILAVTAMYPQNPALELYGRGMYTLPTGELAGSMPEALPRLAAFALKLAQGEPIGPAAVDGYLPRGYRQDALLTQNAAGRAIDLLKRRLAGEPFRTELAVETFEHVTPAPPVADLARARVALVTTSGVVPTGNPDRLRERFSTEWRKYSIAGLDQLSSDKFEPIHGGYDSTWIRDDPDRGVPVDALRAIEREAIIGELYPSYYITVGVGTPVVNARKFGQEIAEDLHREGVDAAILTAT
jgi:glycine reductase